MGRSRMTADGASADRVRSLGVLGGTFDPIHYGHLAIAEQTAEALALDAVLFVPANEPPHKPQGAAASAPDRATMVALAIADNARFRLSRVELDRPGPSYAVDTLERLHAEEPAEYVFILSSEALSGLKSWRNPDRLLELCRIAVVPRPGFPILDRSWVAEHFPGREERVLFMDGPRLGHSASDIRRRVQAGRSIRYLVPREVEAYIAERGLYQSSEVSGAARARAAR
jgi:nicotinate-nucleotide adenylyltransferase